LYRIVSRILHRPRAGIFPKERAMPKKALVFLADGFEEVEAVTPIDFLRRVGIEVVSASIGGDRTVRGSHGIAVTADALVEDLAGHEGGWEVVVIPGGMPGAANIAASDQAAAHIRAQHQAGKPLAAICAAPAVVLAPLGILRGRRFTCYPGMEGQAGREANPGAQWVGSPVAVDGHLITSRGAGTAGAFALAIIGELLGRGEAQKLAQAVVAPENILGS
jgi:4-methyl-5(b-hydroxyethyl)-thiazole monophosphate biosynthesis